MHEITLLINIIVALVAAFFGGLAARRLGLPTIIGYLLAGITIGPFTPGFVGDLGTISQLAELGIIFLMFGIGLSLTIGDLKKVGNIVVWGSLIQISLVTLMGFGLSRLWGWTPAAGLVLGMAISIASSVVTLRGLIDESLLNTPHGQIAVGWLVMQDLFTVLILVMLPTFAGSDSALDWQHLGFTVIKAAVFMGLMLFAGIRLIPWLLRLIAHTRSRELFILAILAIAMGTALSAAELFGVPLALGAFLAGLVISETPLSYQVEADVLPFREAFSVLFFVSVGMLINPVYLFNNFVPVLILTIFVVFAKPLLVTLMGLFIDRPARTVLVVAISNGQIGEFSFILGQAGLALGLLSQDQYSLILAGALLSMTINTWAFRSIRRLERTLQRVPKFWNLLDRHGPAPAQFETMIRDHVVVIGYGRVGSHIVNILEVIDVPHLVIEFDVERVEALNQRGTLTLFGDAANSEVITHAGLERARALVITVPEEATSEILLATARNLVDDLPIIVRAATEEGVKRLVEFGAQDVIHPELEGGLEIVRHTLLRLGFSAEEINRYTDTVRKDHYDLQINTEVEHRLLHELLNVTNKIEIVWVRLAHGNPIVGQTLAETDLRSRTGASVVAILRNKELLANPKSLTVFEVEDRIGLIGDKDQIEAAKKLITGNKIASNFGLE